VLKWGRHYLPTPPPCDVVLGSDEEDASEGGIWGESMSENETSNDTSEDTLPSKLDPARDLSHKIEPKRESPLL